MGVCNCSMFSCTLLYVHSSIAIILMLKRELIALLNLSSWCLVMVERLFLAVPRGCLQFVIVVFPDHTHLLFLWKAGKGTKDLLLGSQAHSERRSGPCPQGCRQGSLWLYWPQVLRNILPSQPDEERECWRHGRQVSEKWCRWDVSEWRGKAKGMAWTL